ncbi:ABC transporter ATP-binding protein [[Clostridium] scindens]|uniref:ABC transporter ATP-binding protein n=1 Tax=Clostridium scindens (strain JCM 10418 / VPI 12708) TaxID=29347 RepID=UPI00156F8FE7|nr:ABC transporter ATP-binding protein [[Clostridium] scindens]NSI89303.1 ABC transporter ATP-binding protein [[Clostridium] scindens]NSJ03934.1 ABC transporter ATP-binding protein [[Clostridium] scindens]
MGIILDVRNLRVSYHTYAGEVQSVRDISFQVNEGETVAIVGESGCGKSVTAKTIMGLVAEPPGEIKSESQVLYLGENILEQSEKEWEKYRGAKCSMIFQDALTSLNPTMNIGRQIEENITNHYKVTKKEARAKAVEMLELVKIPDPAMCLKKYPHELSGGMRQRIMIAIALSGNPKILIADEPTTALDVTIQAQIIGLLKDIQAKLGTTIILITHDLGVVASIADKIIVMYSGKIVEKGECSEIFSSHRHPYTWALLNAAPSLEIKNNRKLISIEGTPPDLINPPKGCPFASRCKYCMNICVEAAPPEYDYGAGHKVLCWLYHPESGYEDIDFNKEAED